MAGKNESENPVDSVDPATQEAYASLLSQLRNLAFFSSKGQQDLKPFLKSLKSASYEAKLMLAIQGPKDGLALAVLKNIQHMELKPEDLLKAVLICVEAEPERSLEHMEGLPLTPSDFLAVLQMAMSHQPMLDFEEFKKIEILYNASESDDSSESKDLRRRYDQARSRRQAHTNRHVLRLIPGTLRNDPDTFFQVLSASLLRDPFGTLDYLRATTANAILKGFLDTLSLDQRLKLLEQAASFGFGLASNYLDLFNVAGEPDALERLKQVFATDCTAGSSIYGVYAFEGVQNFPFGLNKIRPILPKKFNTTDAIQYIKKGELKEDEERTYTTTEIGNTLTMLQEQEVKRFFEQLKTEIFIHWKACFLENKREIIFGDPELKIRNVLFLIAHGIFKNEDYFKQILTIIVSQYPALMDDPPKWRLLANRYFFMEVLGLNPSQLFNIRSSERVRFPFDDVKDFQVRFLLQVGMSVHLHVGSTLFQSCPIAWTMLVNQSEGRLDMPLQEVGQLFDAFDTLLTIEKQVIPDIKSWVGSLLNALVEGSETLPPPGSSDICKNPLRLTTRAGLQRHRKTLNQFCLQALKQNADRLGTTPTSIIQGLRMPRIKTDRLFAMLEEEKKLRKAEEAKHHPPSHM